MYRLLLAALCGLGLSASVVLLLSGPAWIALPAAFLLFPGGFAASVLLHSDSPFIIIASNTVIYSGLAYAFLITKINADPRVLRLASKRVVIPVVIVVGLTFIPTLDPLLPRGLAELKQQESALQNDLPDGMNIEQARSVLRSKNIQFNEFEPPVGPVFQRGETTMTASYGDRLIHSQSQTNASQFLCGYDMRIDLLFDSAGKLKQRDIHRFEICP